MKKSSVLSTLTACLLAVTAAFAQTDYSKKIIGTWSFDLGGGFMSTVEYKADGSLVQKMGDLTMSGTYKVQGNRMTTTVKGQVTEFTIVADDETSITIKRVKDGRTVVYKKQ